MARIDSILAMVVQQGANELRVGIDREPKILAYGAAKRFHMMPTSEETLRELLGEILTQERDEALRSARKLEVAYDAGELGPFRVTFVLRADEGFDAVFLRARGRPEAAPTRLAPVPSPQPQPQMQPQPLPAREVRDVHGGRELRDSGEAKAVPAVDSAPVSAPAAVSVDGAAAAVPCETLVAHAVAMRASDLHLLDGDVPVVRVDGELHRLEHEGAEDVAARLGLDPSAVAAVSSGRALDFTLESADGTRARVNVYRTSRGIAAALRFVSRGAPALSSLGLPLPIDDLVDLPHGLVIVCGATGSGKSTTLAALAQAALARRSIVLLTLEDPIEFTLASGPRSLVRQRQIGRDVRDFPSGLRDALREDPDVLVLGEMRDPETISLAITAAETGHLVLTSLHCGGVASAIERIVDAYPPERQQQVRIQLADTLRAAVAQRLVPRARGVGRVLAAEVLRTNHAVANMIREGKTAQVASVLHSGKREGMIALERHLADRIRSGEVRPEDGRAVANDPDSLAMFLSR
ncbi:type IV pilus twitching motility protein PilT [Pendulispora albinea]|uniref:PilT/PilU family type 4a pilus ATPase n=1 Tax=Pendulispora albinea TaxID=2741071 RepID=A0ABZ2M4U7_9BACT